MEASGEEGCAAKEDGAEGAFDREGVAVAGGAVGGEGEDAGLLAANLALKAGEAVVSE